VIQVPLMPKAVRDLKQQKTEAVSKVYRYAAVNVERAGTSVGSDGKLCQISADNREFFSQIAKQFLAVLFSHIFTIFNRCCQFSHFISTACSENHQGVNRNMSILLAWVIF